MGPRDVSARAHLNPDAKGKALAKSVLAASGNVSQG